MARPYQLDSPAQSTSSLSDVDDDGERNDYVQQTLQPAQMQWTRAGRKSEQPSHASPMDNLPAELLIHVLKQMGSLRDLYTCLLVSRRWCECGVQLVWHKPHIRDERSLKRMLRVLDKRDPSFVYRDFVRRLNLSLLHNDIHNADITRLVNCSKLERLTLMNCKHLSDDALTKLLRSTPELVALDLSGIQEATDMSLLAVAATSPKLQGLNISHCKKMSDAGVTAIAQSCRFLRRIKLMALDNVTDVSLSALASHCPRLLELDLTKCSAISDHGIRRLWTLLVDLRELKVSYCPALTDTAHPAPTPVGPFVPLAASDGSLPPLLLTHRFDHFRILELSGCIHITDDAIAGIIGRAHRIRSLSLAKCANLTDNALRSICGLGRHLHDLHLGHVNKITDDAVVELAQACTRLRYIDLACCNHLTDVAVMALALLPKLRRIGLVRVINLTDDSVYALAQRPPTLERIHLSYCDNISVEAVAQLVQNLPRLMHLSLTGIQSIRESELNLQRYCRNPPSEFTEAQRAQFMVFSGQGVRDLRDYLRSVFSQHNGSSPNDLLDDDDDYVPRNDEFGLDAGMYRDPRDAFMAVPNALLPPRHLTNLRQDSFGQGQSTSAFTTPAGATPRPAGSVTSLHLNGAHAGYHGATNGSPTPIGNYGSWMERQLAANDLSEQLRQYDLSRRPVARSVPFPADDTAQQQQQQQQQHFGTPGASTSASAREDESRGRRVRRSLRSAAEHVASSFFGRSAGGAAGSSNGR
ncbi:RNI-like protein [Auriculariales sp. MPI-PUGE-AT-0066]|nr:RNI-like protein [Auriculariales sp. MPI-PUGE-AT-0066]